MVLGAGFLPEGLFDICLRRDCVTVKALRQRALEYFLALKGVASGAPAAFAAAADKTIRRIGYAAVMVLLVFW